MAALVVGRRNKDPAPPIKEASEYWLLADFGVHYIDFVLCVFGDREPYNSGRNNLRTMELMFAAVASADEGEPTTPGEAGGILPPGGPGRFVTACRRDCCNRLPIRSHAFVRSIRY